MSARKAAGNKTVFQLSRNLQCGRWRQAIHKSVTCRGDTCYEENPAGEGDKAIVGGEFFDSISFVQTPDGTGGGRDHHCAMTMVRAGRWLGGLGISQQTSVESGGQRCSHVGCRYVPIKVCGH